MLSLLALLIGSVAVPSLLSAWRGHRVEPAVPGRETRQLVFFDRFASRRELGDRGNDLTVSLRLRTSGEVDLPCFVFVVARNDRTSPRLWAIWPAQLPGPAITASGHFHGAMPTAGAPLTLSDAWTRLRATIPAPSAEATFDHVVVYVVDPSGRIMLARPFRL